MAKIAVAIGLVLAFLSAGLAPSMLAGHAGGEPVDFLLLGVEDGHADTIVVLHVPASRDAAYFIPLEPDLLVQLPPWPASGYLGGPATLTEAFFHGGAKFTAQTVSRITGLGFDGLAVIDFPGLRNVIDALGPVHLCIDQDTYSHHTVFVDDDPQSGTRMRGHKERILYRKGCQDLPGWAALDYAHDSHHQMRLLKAVAGALADPARLRRALEAAGRSNVLDTNGRPLADFLVLRKAEPVMLREPSQQMFDAVARDQLGRFLVEHPQFVVAP